MWVHLQRALCAGEWLLFGAAVGWLYYYHNYYDSAALVAATCLGASAVLQLAFVVCRRALRVQQRRQSTASVVADTGAEGWHGRLLWAKALLAQWLAVWLMCRETGIVGVYAQLFVSALISAVHALRACTGFLMAHELARADTDGAPGDMDDTCLRLWLIPHVAAWWFTGVVLACLGASAALSGGSWLVWAEIGLLALTCALETRIWIERALVVESPVRFEQVYCTAAQLRTGELGVKATVDEEEGGVILSFTRGDRIRTMRARHLAQQLLAHCLTQGVAAVKTIFF